MIPRVLIIDDEQEWRETFEDVFNTAGWGADSVADISSAKELLKTNSYKLIILDIFLNPTQVPLNYQSFLTFIAQAYPNVFVAAATGKSLAPDEAFSLSRLGVREVIYKPHVQLDDMRRLAHRILGPGDIGTNPSGQMENLSLAVHRTIVAVDVEGFGNRYRTNRNQVAIRDGLYRAMREAFGQAGIPWADRDHEDRGDGMLILVGSEVPKSLFVESLPSALASALRTHNTAHPALERIRLRMALHAGEVSFDEHGATAASINLTFRLLESEPVKKALAESMGVLAVITSSWFFEEVVRHSAADAAAYQAVPVVVKETTTTGWIRLPGLRGPAPAPTLDYTLVNGILRNYEPGMTAILNPISWSDTRSISPNTTGYLGHQTSSAAAGFLSLTCVCRLLSCRLSTAQLAFTARDHNAEVQRRGLQDDTAR